MKSPLLAILFLPIIFSSCNTGSMTVSTYNGASGTGSTTHYSKYYDDGEWAIKGKLGMSVVMDHEKKNIPIVYGLQRSIGGLGPSDLEAKGNLHIFLWNFTEKKQSVVITKVATKFNAMAVNLPAFTIEPKLCSGGKVGAIPISNYAINIPITVNYKIDGKPGVVRLELNRRTYDELNTYFGPKGMPPYPWLVKK